MDQTQFGTTAWPGSPRPGGCDTAPGDIQDQADRGQSHHQAVVAVGNQGQGNPGQRSHSHRRIEVDAGLDDDQAGQCRRGDPAKLVPGRLGNPQAGQGEQSEHEDQGDHPDQTELLTDHGRDHVSVGFRQVEGLLDTVPGTNTVQSTRSDGDLRLGHLEA